MDWSAPETIIALYAAGLSTIVFIWQVIEKLNESKGKIAVDIAIKSQWLVFQNRQLGRAELILQIKITNKGKHPRYIGRPGLEFDEATSMGKVITPINTEDIRQFPMQIGRGETTELNFELANLRASINNTDLTGLKKVRGYTKDTLGETYNSKWMPLKEFMS